MPTRHWRRLLPAIAALGAAGCLQLDTTVKLNEDGSAVVTERLAFSRRLLDMAKGDKGQSPIESLLSREAVTERSQRMGKGVTIASHEIRDGEKGSRESVTVYRVEDLAEFIYASPFLANEGAGAIRFGMGPQLGYDWHGWWPGQLWVTFTPVVLSTNPPPPGAKAGAKPIAPGGTPLDLQGIRDLIPVFGDMLEELQVRIRLQGYTGIQTTDGLAFRGQGSRVDYVDLIAINGRNMDQYGYPVMRNEETMKEVLLGQLASGPFLNQTLAGMRDNTSLPLLHRQGHGARLSIPPSRALFKRYYEGQTIDWTGSLNPDVKARGKKPADFKECGGWEKPAVEHKPVEVDNCPTNCPWCR